jgi:pilus assembly protein CpaD
MAKRFHIALSGALAGLPLIALAGCMQSQEQIAWSNRMHTQIVAQETTAELKIGTVVAGEKLGMRERDAVKGFATAYQQEGHGAVIISRPSNGPDDISAIRAAADARAVMLAEGVDQGMIAEGTYDGTGARSAPLIISYRTYEAVVPNCPDISHWDFTDISSNSALPSLGCAVAVNLAAMIANPSDLVGEQPMDPADTTRRTIMFSKYRQGERSSAVRNDDASGAISTAVD